MHEDPLSLIKYASYSNRMYRLLKLLVPCFMFFFSFLLGTLYFGFSLQLQSQLSVTTQRCLSCPSYFSYYNVVLSFLPITTSYFEKSIQLQQMSSKYKAIYSAIICQIFQSIICLNKKHKVQHYNQIDIFKYNAFISKKNRKHNVGSCNNKKLQYNAIISKQMQVSCSFLHLSLRISNYIHISDKASSGSNKSNYATSHQTL